MELTQWDLVMRKIRLFLFVFPLCWLGGTSCSDAKLESYECPSAGQLEAGVDVRCGDSIVSGTLDASAGGAATCSADGQTDCLAKAPFKVADATKLTPSQIKEGVIVAGVTGNIAAAAGVGVCTVDGENLCYANDDFVGAKIATLPAKLAAGKKIGDVQGTAVLDNAAACSTNAEVGCLTSSSYVAMRSDLATQCLLSGGGSLHLAGAAPQKVQTSQNSQTSWYWTNNTAALNASEAQTACAGLATELAGDGSGDSPRDTWRLPTKKEALQAYVDDVLDKIGKAAPGDTGPLPIWTLDPFLGREAESWLVDLRTGETKRSGSQATLPELIFTACVRTTP